MNNNKKYNIHSIMNKYFPNDDAVDFFYCGEGKEIRYFLSLLENGELTDGDAPDMVLVNQNDVVIMEHFQFDSFPATKRKGSLCEREKDRIDRVYDAAIATEDGVYFHDKFSVANSYEDYITNVKRSFLEHYSKIENYKNNLRNRGIINNETNLKVAFVLEDTSILGTIVADANKQLIPVELHRCSEFLEFLSQCPCVDYILCFSSINGVGHACFINTKELSAYKDESYDYGKMRFVPFVPQVVMFKKYV